MADPSIPDPTAELGVTSLEEWSNLHLQQKLDPASLWPPLLRPCVVRILMVTDGGGSFGTDSFGLKALLDALAVPPGPWVRFEITTANRRQDPTAKLQNFNFAATSLKDFDQIWLIGVEGSFSEGLSDKELRAISEFMDNGGGVFATGDHEDLGVSMSGRVPRVRSMRKWHWPNPGPNGEPVAPPGSGPGRIDTLRQGSSPGYQFDDQSDDLPQNISPRMYPTWVLPWFSRPVHPHPVLCGPRGVIRVLPDHPHEGECYVPSDLTKSFTFDGYTIEEYPGPARGARLRPEIIATSTVLGGRTDADVKGPVDPRSFGAIGVWDGHRVKRGRVLVDATWHHFFNINLVGDPFSPDPAKRIGFAATPAGQAAYEEIKSYYRNIAVWLARPERQLCMRWRALWICRWHHRVRMDLKAAGLKSVDNLDLAELLRVGKMARDVLGRYASQCQAYIWCLDICKAVLAGRWALVEPYVDPWRPVPPQPEPDPQPEPWIHASNLVDAALGGAIYSLGSQFPQPGADARDKAEELDWEGIVRPGVELAAQRALEASERSVRALDSLASGLRQAAAPPKRDQ